MNRIDKRMIIYIVLTVLWMIFIFLHSAMPADVSQTESNFLSDFIADIFKMDREVASFIVRKSAHFLEYTVLGCLVSLAAGRFACIKGYNSNVIYLCSWAIGTFYAVTDEFHQNFVEGRSCELRDMAIDACGVLLGVVIIMLIRSLRRRRSEG